MRKWLVLAPYDVNGKMVSKIADAVDLERLAIFSSVGDGEEPRRHDFEEALAEHLVANDERQELVLVPLDDAATIEVVVRPKLDLLSTGSFGGPA